MEIVINKAKKEAIKIIQEKVKKSELQCNVNDDNIVIEAKYGSEAATQVPIPVSFQGKVVEKNDGIIIKGKFSNGFYLSKLLIVAIVLIGIRFLLSVYQKQIDNIILCGIVTALLAIVYVVAQVKGKPLRKKIKEILSELE